MSSFGFGFGQTPNSFNPPKPFSETKTAFGWSPFGNTTPPCGTTTIPALATNNATSGTASSPAFDFSPVFGAPVFNSASAPASGTNCTITLATTGSPVFGTSTPTIGTTVTITPGVGTSSAPTGGTNAIAITINVGTASTSSVGNGITIAPSVGSTVTIAPASGTSITLMQAAGTTITITSNPTSGVTSTPGIGAASTPTVCFPTSTAPASTRGGFGFPTSTAPASTRGGFGFPTSTAPASTQGGFGFPTFTSPTSTQGGFGFPASTAPASTQGGFGFPTYTTPASTSTFSSSKVGASSQFGTQSSPFGAQPTPIVGNNASRQSASGSHQGHGSRVVPYTASIDADSFSAASPIKIHSISAMPIHKHKCHEELRWEDYQLGDKGGAIPPGGSSKHTTQSFVQKEKRASFCPFGCPFAQTSSSTFNTSTSSPCAERSTSLFAQPSSNPFGPRPSPSPFGAQPSSSTFGAKPSSSTFGPPPSSSSFGAQPSSSIFGLPPSSSPFGAIFGNSTFAPSSFGQTSSPNPSWFMPSQVSEPVETSTSPFHSNLTNTGSSPSFY
uniref:nuclear pore complex protein NUP98B-like isoform X2 n=1 Tax=Fragaria vesca subsp. vesca TaxID=101020 RepID=UPI0005C96F6C|nr:PREDICTED: nuclear pore complex protein NUP98B-like isoform X2 [Fragaria vesca subsp. vesca]